MVAAGGFDSLALRSDGTVVAWGNDSFGQLALRNDGTVASWGADDKGQLGDSAALANQLNVVGVGGVGLLSGMNAIEAGLNHSVALGNHLVFSWGDNSQAQLGDGSSINRATPVPMESNISTLFFSPSIEGIRDLEAANPLRFG